MKTSHPKILGITLIAAALALFGWVLYDASNLVSTLHLSGFADEAAVAMVALAVAGLSFAGGGVLLLNRRATRL